MRLMFNACVGVFIAIFSIFYRYSHKLTSFGTIRINHIQAKRNAYLPSCFTVIGMWVEGGTGGCGL